jgi:soluble lytic murein transglycosylase-like protein
MRIAIPMLALAVSYGTLFAASPAPRRSLSLTPSPAPAVSTTVRAARNGRLVRSVVVPANVVKPRLVTPVDPAAAEPGAITTVAELDALIEETASREGVDPLLVHAVIHTESAYNPYAISYKGAEGLMQLIPGTARLMGVRNSFDIRQNVEGGVKYLKQMLDRFDDLRFAIAAYNAGPEAVARYRGIPPYAETIGYVYRVGKRYGDLRRQHPPKPATVAETQTQPQPEFRPVESYLDDQGRLNLRTR